MTIREFRRFVCVLKKIGASPIADYSQEGESRFQHIWSWLKSWTQVRFNFSDLPKHEDSSPNGVASFMLMDNKDVVRIYFVLSYVGSELLHVSRVKVHLNHLSCARAACNGSFESLRSFVLDQMSGDSAVMRQDKGCWGAEPGSFLDRIYLGMRDGFQVIPVSFFGLKRARKFFPCLISLFNWTPGAAEK